MPGATAVDPGRIIFKALINIQHVWNFHIRVPIARAIVPITRLLSEIIH